MRPLFIALMLFAVVACKEQSSSSSASSSSSSGSSSSSTTSTSNSSGSTSPAPGSTSSSSSSVPVGSQAPGTKANNTAKGDSDSRTRGREYPTISAEPSPTMSDADSNATPPSEDIATQGDNPIPSQQPAAEREPEIDFSEDSSSSNPATDGHKPPPMSDAEKQAVLEGQLETSIANYDGMIQREQDYINDRAQRQSEAVAEEVAATVPYDDPSLEDSETQETAAGPAPRGGAETSGSETVKTGQGTVATANQRSASATPSANPPADIPDGSDDDVVARQIREAAEQETDPVLREKLWEEYRKYKSGQ